MTNELTTTRSVLIVEDEPDYAALLRSILEKAGYSVATAYLSEDALIEVQEHKPDVITLDLHMPRQSGALFYRKLKANEAFRDIPVIVVTGLALDDDGFATLIRSFLERDNLPHPEAYLEKPVDAARLLQTIEETLACSSSADR